MMKSLVDNSKNKFLFLTFIYTGFFFIYKDYFIEDPLLGRDDSSLVLPIMNTNSLNEYWLNIASNKILDVQPLRDFSFWINLKIQSVFQYSSFHLLNFFVFCLVIYQVFNLFQNVFLNNYYPYVFSLLFCLHPIMVSAVGWVSARKHSLATLMILISLNDFLRKKEVTLKAVLFYSFSLLSHQLYFLYPVWICLYSNFKKYKVDYRLIGLMVFLGSCIVFVASFKTFYINSQDVIYTESARYIENVSRFILSWGRTVVLVLFPYSISASYYQGSSWNLVGIFLGVFFIFILIKFSKVNAKEIFYWLVFCGLTFTPTIIAFVNDTYLYLVLILILICVCYFYDSINSRFYRKICSIFFSIYIFFFAFKTKDASTMWMGNAQLWQYSYINEKSPYNAILLSSHLRDERISIELLTWGAEYFDFSRNRDLALYFGYKIFHSNVMTREEKLKTLRRSYFNFYINDMYIGLLQIYGNETETSEGLKKLDDIKVWWGSKDNSFPFYTELIRVNVTELCRNFPDKKFVCNKLGFDLKDHK